MEGDIQGSPALNPPFPATLLFYPSPQGLAPEALALLPMAKPGHRRLPPPGQGWLPGLENSPERWAKDSEGVQQGGHCRPCLLPPLSRDTGEGHAGAWTSFFMGGWRGNLSLKGESENPGCQKAKTKATELKIDSGIEQTVRKCHPQLQASSPHG